LLARGDSDVVFLTWHLHRAWWESFGSGGELMLIVAEREGQPVALAPFYTQSQMIFLVGSKASDYLDFIGDISDPEVLDALLQAGRDQVECNESRSSPSSFSRYSPVRSSHSSLTV